MYSALLLLAAALFTVVAWRNRKTGLLLIAAALPAYLLRFSLGPVPFTLLEAFILLLAGAWIVRGEWRSVASLPRPWQWLAGTFVAVGGIATTVSPDTQAALGAFKAYVVEPVLLFLVAATVLKTEADRRALLAWFVGGAAFASLVGVMQFALGAGIPAPWDVERRVTGPFPYPNALGLYAGPGAVAAALFAFRERGRSRMMWIVAGALCAAGIALAQSEAAAAAVLGTLFVASLFAPRVRRVTVPTAALLLLVILAVPSMRSFAWQKASVQDGSGLVRRSQWEETWQLLKDQPVAGAGLAGYPEAFAPYHLRTDLEIFQYPHTLIFNIWTELGLAGLAWFAAAAALAVAAARRAWRARNAGGFPALAAFALLGQSAVHGLVDVPYFKNDLAALTWLLFALLCLAYAGTDQRATKEGT